MNIANAVGRNTRRVPVTSTYEAVSESIDAMLAANPDIRVISFDVFDTLVMRRCAREAVGNRVLRELRQALVQHGYKPLVPLESARAAAIDSLALASAEAGADPEFHIDDLYPEVLRRVAGDAIEPVVVDSISKEMVKFEVQAERRACVAIEPMLDTVRSLRERNIRLVVTSDMYLGRDHLETLLDALGYGGMFDRVLVSGDGTGYKSTGRAFLHLLEVEQLRPAELLHIGDHEQADIEAAHRLGIHTVRIVDPILDEARLSELADRPFDLDGQVLALARWTATPPPPTELFSESYGYEVVGPIFASFLQRTLAAAVADGVDQLFFLSRDGYAPLAMYDEVAAAGLLPPDSPPARYLAISRLPTIRALVGGPSMRLAIESARNQLVPTERTIRNTLAALGMDTAVLEQEASNRALDFDGYFTDEMLASAEFRDFIACPVAIENAAQAGGQAKGLLLDYLAQEGFFDGQRAGLVDIGWGGTIQDQLRALISDVPDAPELFGYYVGGNVSLFDRRAPGSRLSPIIGSVFTDQGEMELGNSAVFASIALLEEASRAPHGTCVGYERQGSRILPLVKPDEDRQLEAGGEASLSGLQRGMIRYAVDHFDAVDFLMLGSDAALAVARSAVQRMVFTPDIAELDFWRRLTHTNDIGGIFQINERLLPDNEAWWNRPRKVLPKIRASMWTHGAARYLVGPAAAVLYNPVWALSYARQRQFELNLVANGHDLKVKGVPPRAGQASHPAEDRLARSHSPTEQLYRAARTRTKELNDGVKGTARPLLNARVAISVAAMLTAAQLLPAKATSGVRVMNDGFPVDRILRRRAASRLAPVLTRASFGRRSKLRIPLIIARRVLRC